MDKNEKKRIIKALAGGAVYMVAMIKSRKLIEEKVTRQPHSDIAVQLSNTFWSICYTLYAYYVVGEKESWYLTQRGLVNSSPFCVLKNINFLQKTIDLE